MGDIMASRVKWLMA